MEAAIPVAEWNDEIKRETNAFPFGFIVPFSNT